MEEDEKKELDEYSRMVNNNSILLQFEGWIKYIEGFTKGIESTDKVNSAIVLDCVGEILEYMTQFRQKLLSLVVHCEEILEENEKLKIVLNNSIQEDNNGKDL